ncbi:MAG: VWA domain-containing protein [Marinicaulis sp.]|nr:VWA domain-containing protein [Marinicaulis sp.]
MKNQTQNHRTKNLKNKLFTGAVTLSAVLAVGTGQAFAQDASEASAPQSVMMVLDGSGSMWGQIDGVAKIEIARDVIGGLLDDWDPAVQLGVIAYGHREKGACNDIEMLVNVGPVDSAAVMAKINAINPKGKTPISASVRKAAESLKYTEEKATVILISDGLETCSADPCALADELEANGVDFTTHVIGFDIKDEEKAGLVCLAERTGGRYMSAQNAQELTTALAETVEIVATAETLVPVDEPEPVAQGPQGVRFSAKLCETCEIVEDNMFWWINESKQDLEGNRKEVARNGRAKDLEELPAGDYQIVARYGDAYANQMITIEPGKLTELVMVMNAGHFRVNAAATVGGQILSDNMFYWVMETATNLEGQRKEVSRSGLDKELFRLPAGDYLVRARHGDAYAEHQITVSPGGLTDHTFDMNVGYLRVDAAMSEGGPQIAKDMFYWVLASNTDLEGNRREVSRSGANKDIFRLPAGDYLLRSRHGVAITDTAVTVTAGGLLDKTIIQNSGRVKLSVVQTVGAPALSDGVFWWVYQPTGNLEGSEREISRDGRAEPIFTLPAGEFTLAVRYGGKVTRTKLVVKPGDEKKIEVVLNP